jgi:hypothetical protein
LLTRELALMQCRSSLEPGSRGSWRLIGGGPSRAVDRYYQDQLNSGYFEQDLGGSPGTNEGNGDFDNGFVDQVQIGATGPSLWPRARFGSSAWSTPVGSRTHDGIIFGGMITRPCFTEATIANQKLSSGLGPSSQDTFLMPNDLWGFSADTGQFSYLGGSQSWMWRTNVIDVDQDWANGYGALTPPACLQR